MLSSRVKLIKSIQKISIQWVKLLWFTYETISAFSWIRFKFLLKVSLVLKLWRTIKVDCNYIMRREMDSYDKRFNRMPSCDSELSHPQWASECTWHNSLQCSSSLSSLTHELQQNTYQFPVNPFCWNADAALSGKWSIWYNLHAFKVL